MPGSETGSAKSFAFAIRSLLESSVPFPASVPLYGVKSFSSRAFAARKQLAEFFHGCGSHASQLGVGVSVLRARHSDQCRGDPRSRPRELQGALRIVLQAEGFRNESGQVAEAFGLENDAQRALQFARSAPGITTALVGMSRAEHAHANAKLAGVTPATVEEFSKLFSRGEGA